MSKIFWTTIYTSSVTRLLSSGGPAELAVRVAGGAPLRTSLERVTPLKRDRRGGWRKHRIRTCHCRDASTGQQFLSPGLPTGGEERYRLI